MIKKILYLLIIVLPSNLLGQDTIPDLTPQYGFYFGTGLILMNFDNLNNYFKEHSIKEINGIQNYYSGGFSIRNKASSLYLLMKGSFYNSKKINPSSLLYNSSLNGWNIDLSFHYNILKKQNLLVYPKFSVGIKKNNLIISKGNFINNNFDLYFQNNFDNIFFNTNEIVYMNFGAGFEKRIKIFYSNLFLGFNVSYLIPINKIIWFDINNNRVYNFPNTKFNNLHFEFYERLEINWEKIITHHMLHYQGNE